MNKSNPKISVIIPTYNRAKILPRAIKSVLNQTFQDFELIITDDGSADNTKEVVERFQKKDKRIKYFYQKNGGSAKARNLGIKNGKGEYIAFLDSDDEWFPDKLLKQIVLFKQSQKPLSFVGCGSFDIITNTGKKKKITPPKNYLSPPISKKKELVIFDIHSASSVMIKKNTPAGVSLFDEKLKISEDRDFWLRIIQNGGAMGFIREPLFNYYIHASNISATENFSKKIDSFLYFIDKHKKKSPYVASVFLRNIGSFYLLQGGRKKAIHFFLKSIKTAPFLVQNYINLFLSIIWPNLYKKIYYKRQK